MAAFVEAYAAQLPDAFVVVKATGGYETALLAALLEQEVTVHRTDPRASSFFLRSLGAVARRADPVAMRTAEMNRRQQGDLLIQRGRDAFHTRAELVVARMLDRRIDTLVRATTALAAKMQVLIAIPGVGRQTAVMRKLITIANAKLRDHAMPKTWRIQPKRRAAEAAGGREATLCFGPYGPRNDAD